MDTDVTKTLVGACLLILAAPAIAATTVFVNVNVISMLEPDVSSAQTVIVADGRIVEMGAVDQTASR